MDLSLADVWNRACDVDRSANGPGDVHLWALLRAHGPVCGGGTTFAKEVLDPSVFAAASEACDYFSLSELADLMKRIAVMNSDDELEMNEEYYRLADDQVLMDAFERRYAASPDDFDPVDV